MSSPQYLDEAHEFLVKSFASRDEDLLISALSGNIAALSALPQRSTTAKEELDEFNIEREYNAIKKLVNLRGGYKDKYEEGRFKTLQYMINCVSNDHQNGDYYNEDNNALMTNAGKLLNQYDGMDGMRDPLVWSFIPKRYHRGIDYMWDGIGDWKC